MLGAAAADAERQTQDRRAMREVSMPLANYVAVGLSDRMLSQVTRAMTVAGIAPEEQVPVRQK